MQVLPQAMVLVLWNAMQIMQKSLLSFKDKIKLKLKFDPAGIDSAGGVSAGKTSAGSVPAAGNPAGTFQPAGSYDPAALGDPAASTSVSADFIPVHADESTLPPGQHCCGSESVVPTNRGEHNSSSVKILEDLAFSSSDKEAKAQNSSLVILEPSCIAKALVDLIGFFAAMQTRFVRNKSKVGSTGHRQEEGIDYDEMDVRVPFSMEKLKKKCMALTQRALKILTFPQSMCTDVVKRLCYGFHQALEPGEFEMSAMGEMSFFLGLQVKQLPDGIFISQDKYVKDMLTKFDMESVRTATTPYEAAKTKLKDETDPPVIVTFVQIHDWCIIHQVTPLGLLNLNAVKEIRQVSKGQPKLGLWYPKDSHFQLEAYSEMIRLVPMVIGYPIYIVDSIFLGRRLISWQCKKQTIVATSSTEAEYVAAASCCAQVLWIQNQLLDYGFNFMNTKIFIDNQSTICIVKNPVFHQRTKHIEIRHHFIRDANEKNLIQVLKIHTDDNVADLLTKAFDGPRFEYWCPYWDALESLFVVNTAAGCTFSLLSGFMLDGSVYIGGGAYLLVDSFLLIRVVGSCCLHGSVLVALFLLDCIISAAGVVYAANTSTYAAELVCAGRIMFLLADLFLLFLLVAMDSAGSRCEIGVSPFADSAASSLPSNVSIDHIPIDVLFESTSGGILEFFLDSDEEEKIGMSRVVADTDSDDKVFAEIIFQGKSMFGDGVVFMDKLPDDEIVDPRVKVETISESASSPPSWSRRNSLGDMELFLRVLFCPWIYECGKTVYMFCGQGISFRQSRLAVGKHYVCRAYAPLLEAVVLDVATLLILAVHRVHAVSFDAAILDVAATVSAACIIAAGSPCICWEDCWGIIEKDQVSFLLLEMFISADGTKWFLLARENGVRKFTEQCVGKASHAQTRRVPIPVTTPESSPSTVLKMTVPSTTEEKICKKNDVKARSLLLMALLNEHHLTFNQYVDAQSMFVAIKARFGGNDATKKTQKALLKQQYENFNATSSESLDSIFNRLQKLVSRLAILGVDTPSEDLNVKF
ncbi:hypothetical protein Tco_0836258 [Tanacetum coccineum]